MPSDALTVNQQEMRGAEAPDTFIHRAFGFWIYMMTDLVLFAALFATYAVLMHNTAGGPGGKEIIELSYTLIETQLLLLSSFTCGLAILGMAQKSVKMIFLWLAVTFLLGSGFMGMEIHEFYRLVKEGHGPDRSGYLSAYFTLVGTHGVHVTVGLIWAAVMMVQVPVMGLVPAVRSRLFRFSMFWHFLDIVWVCVFTIVYLIGST